MGRVLLALVAASTLLSGCSSLFSSYSPPRVLSDEQVAWLRSEVETIGAECRRRRVAGVVTGYAGSVKCSNPGILAAYQMVDFPYMSVLNLSLARRLQLAERADDKKISEGDMLVDFYSDVRSLPAMPTP